MKNYSQLLGAALLITCASTLLFGQEGQKKPAIISQAQGAVNKTYALVQTTIYRDPQEAGARPLVSRAMIDTIGPNRQNSKALEVKLETPVPPVTLNTYGVTKVVDQIGQVVGSIGSAKVGGQELATNPKLAIIGKSVQLAAAFTDVAVKIAESELSKLYENQQIRINLLEIIPLDYYEINESTGRIDHTSLGIAANEAYADTLTRYLQAFAEYRQYENAFIQMSTKLRAIDPSGKKYPDQWAQARSFDTERVQSRLQVKNNLEDDLSRLFPPYRIAIMASPSDPGNTCGAAGQGPWELYVIYYIGAKQTNRIAVKYCVKNPKDFQRLLINVVKNVVQQVNPQQNLQQFIPGGVQLTAESNATFAQTTGLGQVNFNAPQTEVFNWFQSMVTNPAADTIAQFLLPFDINTMRQTLAQRAAANPADAELQALSKRMDDFANAIIDAQQQAATLEEQREKQEREAAIKQKTEELRKVQAELDKYEFDLKTAGREPDQMTKEQKEQIFDLEQQIKKLETEIKDLTGASAAATTTTGLLRSTTPTTRTQATQTTPATSGGQPRTSIGQAVVKTAEATTHTIEEFDALFQALAQSK